MKYSASLSLTSTALYTIQAEVKVQILFNALVGLTDPSIQLQRHVHNLCARPLMVQKVTILSEFCVPNNLAF